MTTSISSEAFEKKQESWKTKDNIKKKQKNGQHELLSRCLLLSFDLF